MIATTATPHQQARNLYGVNYLLGVDSDPKTAKSNALGKYLTAIMYLQPGGSLCASASPGCLSACLHTAGNPAFWRNKEKARSARTTLFRQNRELFLACLRQEISNFVDRCETYDLLPAIRLNGTSDIVWEKIAPELFSEFPYVQFYDYTKHSKRVQPGYSLPENYDLTLSRSETNESDVLKSLANGARVSVVFATARTKDLPQWWKGFPVIDADKHDLRFGEGKGLVCGLRAKGKARSDGSGFVVASEETYN